MLDLFALLTMGFSGTYTGVILAHTLIGIPYMLRILVVSFESMPQDILDAASNLGAGPWVRLKEVYLPMLLPSVVSGSIFTFINSMEEFTMSFIIGLPAVKTLPTVLFTYLGEGFSQTRASVVSLILLIPNLALLIMVEMRQDSVYGRSPGKNVRGNIMRDTYTGPMRFVHWRLAQSAPENTLDAFQGTADGGYEGIEIEVKASGIMPRMLEILENSSNLSRYILFSGVPDYNAIQALACTEIISCKRFPLVSTGETIVKNTASVNCWQYF